MDVGVICISEAFSCCQVPALMTLRRSCCSAIDFLRRLPFQLSWARVALHMVSCRLDAGLCRDTRLPYRRAATPLNLKSSRLCNHLSRQQTVLKYLTWGERVAACFTERLTRYGLYHSERLYNRKDDLFWAGHRQLESPAHVRSSFKPLGHQVDVHMECLPPSQGLWFWPLSFYCTWNPVPDKKGDNVGLADGKEDVLFPSQIDC
jgi:hypothetical protein